MDKDEPNEESIDHGRRRFLVAATTVIGGVGVVGAAVPFVASWLPSAKAQAAAAPVEVDVSRLEPGAKLTVEWRGKPVWIIHRSKAALAELKKSGTEHLRDPNSEVAQQPAYASNPLRSLNPNYLILIGICTHLGCVPIYRPDIGGVEPGWPGGFFCPCHGSKFDLAGRVYKGVPAPINLEVPPYKFISDSVVIIGEDAETA